MTQDSIDSINPDEHEGPFFGLAERSIDIVSAFALSAITNNSKDSGDSILAYLEDIWNYSWSKKHLQFVHSVAAKILDVWLLAVEHKLEIPRLPVAAYNAYHAKKLWAGQNKSAPDIFEYKVMRIGITSRLNEITGSTGGAARLLADFRLLDVPGYDINLANFLEFLKDEREKTAYQYVFDLSVTFCERENRECLILILTQARSFYLQPIGKTHPVALPQQVERGENRVKCCPVLEFVPRAESSH